MAEPSFGVEARKVMRMDADEREAMIRESTVERNFDLLAPAGGLSVTVSSLAATSWSLYRFRRCDNPWRSGESRAWWKNTRAGFFATCATIRSAVRNLLLARC